MVVRVLVVDDYQPWLRFVRSMLQNVSELQVIGEASDGREAVQKAVQLHPDLILLDIGLPTLNGIDAARKIREHDPAAKIIFVTEQHSDDLVHEALSTGSAYVVKFNAATELLPAIRAILDFEPKRAENRHEVNSYPDSASFVDGFARFVETGLENGKAIVVLASDSHRVRILQSLKSQGLDIAVAIEQNRYLPLDISDGFHNYESLARDAVKAAAQRNLRVGVA